MKRNRYSKELKTKVAVVAFKGHRTASEIASEFGVHVSQVNRWKKQALASLPCLFGNSQAKKEEETEKELDRLDQQTGRLQVELSRTG